MSNIVVPDAILTGGILDGVTEPWQSLDPCPACGKTQHQAPEGTNPDGTPRWNFPHCYACGFRPGTNSAIDQERMKTAFELFKKYVQDNDLYQHPSLQPPNDAEKDALKAQLAQVNAQLAAHGITPEA